MKVLFVFCFVAALSQATSNQASAGVGTVTQIALSPYSLPLDGILATIGGYSTEEFTALMTKRQLPIWDRKGQKMILNQLGEYVGTLYSNCNGVAYGPKLTECLKLAIWHSVYKHKDPRTGILYDSDGYDPAGIFRANNSKYRECYGYPRSQGEHCINVVDARVAKEESDRRARQDAADKAQALYCRSWHPCKGNNARWSYSKCECECERGSQYTYPNCPGGGNRP